MPPEDNDGAKRESRRRGLWLIWTSLAWAAGLICAAFVFKGDPMGDWIDIGLYAGWVSSLVLLSRRSLVAACLR